MVMKKFKKPWKEFMLRFEAPNDLVKFISLAIKEHTRQFDHTTMGCPTGDTFVFEGHLDLYEVQEMLSRIPDGHVMLETVQYINEYTGERRKVEL